MSSGWPALLTLLLTPVVVAGCGSASHTDATSNQPGSARSVLGTPTSRVSTAPASTSVPAATGTPTSSAPTAVPAAPGGTVSAVPAAATPASNACATSRLLLAAGSVEHAAGSSYATFYLRNTGPASCVLYGFPGVSLLDAHGRIIQRPANWNGAARSSVTVRPGARAQFVLQTIDPAIPGTGCSTSWQTARIQVYPPNQTSSLSQPSSLAACDLSVGPVQAAS